MRILAVSDLHGDLESVREALARFPCDLLLSCGDWGDPEELTEADLAWFPTHVPVLSTFGNHDPGPWLAALRNQDGSTVELGQGETREVAGLRVAAIGGIWAKSHRLPHYVTNEDVAEAAARIAATGPVDILLTHGCPVGLADLTPKGTHGGQRCFLDAWHTVAPRLHLCGHLHVPQVRTFKDGRQVINVGATPDGSVVVIDRDGDALTARLESIRGRGPGGAR
jgi:Icc-related predicted phosphoesterase